MTAYLDHAATTPLRPRALDAMMPFLTDDFGNPSGAHSTARRARKAVDEARDSIADCLGVRPGEIIFTSGGTESDNLAIKGVAPGRQMLSSAIEHPAVLEPVRRRSGHFCSVNKDGQVDIGSLESIGFEPGLVSVMAANNETGVIQPIEQVRNAFARRRVTLHSDAVQAVPWLDPADYVAHAELISVSAHKFGGPKGTGALVVKSGTALEPLLHGGGQERELRSGTQNVAGIAGMAAALREVRDGVDQERTRVLTLRDSLITGILHDVPGASLTGRPELLLPGHAHFRFEGIESEALLVLLDEAGIAASAASSCASGALQPSHVLTAMGYSVEESRSGVRFSLGWTSTSQDVDMVLKVLPDTVKRLRAAA